MSQEPSTITNDSSTTLETKESPRINNDITTVISTKLKFPLLEETTAGDDVTLLAPWKVYAQRPTYLSKTLNKKYADQSLGSKINVLMDSKNSDNELSGKLDNFCELWVIKCKSDADIDVFLENLESQFSVLQVRLVERKVFRDSIEIPMLVFVNNRSEAMETLKNNLKMVKEAGWNDKKFSYEIDYGPAIESWASHVLKRDFICIGGRFCITNAASFNHVLDWNNLLSCFICGPCGLMAGAAYRIGRKVRYLESIITPKHDVMLVGANGTDGDDQRDALMSLIRWMSEDLPSPTPRPPLTTREITIEHHPTPEPQEINNDEEANKMTPEPEDHTMPEVDSNSAFKSRYKFDPRSYQTLVEFLASDKPNEKAKRPRNPNSNRRISSFRSPVRRNEMRTKTNTYRRGSVPVTASIGETNV